MNTIKNTNEYNLWLHQVSNLYFKMIKIIFIYPLAFGNLLKVLVSISGNFDFFDCSIEFTIAVFSTLFIFFAILSNQHARYLQTYALLTLFEFSNTVILILYVFGGTYNEKILLVMTSFITLMEFLLIEISSWKILVFQLKNILLWIYFDFLIYGSLKADFFKNSVYLLITLVLSLFVLAIVRDRVLKVVFDYKQQIMKKQQNLETVLEYMPDGLMVLSMDMKVKLLNSSLKTILQISNENDLLNSFAALQYSPSRRVYGLEDSLSLQSDVAGFLSKPQQGPVTFGVTEIGDKFYEWKGSISKWNKKNALILLARDITALIELEKSQAIQACHTMMMRCFSHELRTPVSAILSTNESLMTRGSVESKEYEKLEMIGVNSFLLLNLINNMLDYVQFYSNKFKINRSHFDLKNLIDETLKLFQIQARHKNLSIISNLDPFIPSRILNDSERARQVLINLLINAIK
jgi:signal transduction histidine kinase